MKTLSKKRLSETLISKRKELNFTQKMLSEATGINRAMISRAEKMDYVPSIEQLEKLSEQLHFDITDLFEEKRSVKKTIDKHYNIAVAGTGYVGLSIATLLSQHHHVEAVDIVKEKVDMINNHQSPIQDDYIEKYLKEKELDLHATLDGEEAYRKADFVVIAAPTNYDSKKNFFNTSAVEDVISLVLKVNPHA
ncbi:MAG TPA: UDP-glucose 6-dehydrogenase, partial [Kandleria vitulina]|nr:UDP-glucose 6-dehydrogenase [Kandleria vitulina]